MPFVPMNILLDKPLAIGGTLTMPYPAGKNEGHFTGAVNHTLAVDSSFFRSPIDFIVFTQPDRIVFTWQGKMALPPGSLLNLQLDMPGGDFYYDAKLGITVINMVASPFFMINLGAPEASDPNFWLPAAAVSEAKPLKPARASSEAARNVIVHSEQDNSACIFTIEGEDMYKRTMVEKILAGSGANEGKKAFARILRITPSAPCNGNVSVGSGDRLGLPVFLPSPGYVIREVINGVATNGGTILSGETGMPAATTGDRRGTYTPPVNIALDGKHSIHLLLSLPAPGNIGIPDYAGG